uniref:FHA domain-containing protein n=1 Tax=Caenorhabditis tropicalis TaxID=1561998 RepID=A0A1I7TJ20_9PELO
MDPYIEVEGHGKTVPVAVDEDGTVNEETLRAAFLLEQEVPIGLYRNKLALKRRRQGNELVFELKANWSGAKFEIKWEEERRSRLVKSIDQGAPKPKRQKVEPDMKDLPVDGDILAEVQQYCLYFIVDDFCKRNVVPLTPRLAATSRSGENLSFEIGDVISIYSSFDKKFKVTASVVKCIDMLDIIILQSLDADFCKKNLVFNSTIPEIGTKNLQMGYSVDDLGIDHHLLSTGVVASHWTLTRYTGSTCFYNGGASCWDENEHLMGIQVEVGEEQHDTGTPYTASGGRCCIVLAHNIFNNIRELLPPVRGNVCIQLDSDDDDADNDIHVIDEVTNGTD